MARVIRPPSVEVQPGLARPPLHRPDLEEAAVGQDDQLGVRRGRRGEPGRKARRSTTGRSREMRVIRLGELYETNQESVHLFNRAALQAFR